MVATAKKTTAKSSAARRPTAKKAAAASARASVVRATTMPQAPAYSVRLTHPDRIYWDDAGVTKEGLAEYYELPPERGGVNALHVDALVRTGAMPDLSALERLDQVQQMGRPQYQESWAWVHFMMRGSPEARAVLLGYLQQLREPRPPGPLLPRLREVQPALNEALARHVARLNAPAANSATMVASAAADGTRPIAATTRGSLTPVVRNWLATIARRMGSKACSVIRARLLAQLF